MLYQWVLIESPILQFPPMRMDQQPVLSCMPDFCITTDSWYPKKGHHSCVFDYDLLKSTANSTLFNFQLAAWTRCKRQGLEKKIHFIPSPVVQGQPRMEVFRLPSWERQPLLPCSSLQQIKGACCTFFRRKRQGAKKRSGNGRVMGMARTPALGSP